RALESSTFSMGRPAGCITRFYSAVLDGELDRFLVAACPACRSGIDLRTRCSGGAHRWNHLARSLAHDANEMGNSPTRTRHRSLNAANCRLVSVELSLATV